MSYEIASPLSYQVLEKRRRLQELSAPDLDNAHRRAYRVAGYRPFIADVDELDGANPSPQGIAAVGADDEEGQ